MIVADGRVLSLGICGRMRAAAGAARARIARPTLAEIEANYIREVWQPRRKQK